jgi:hypothetical protein
MYAIAAGAAGVCILALTKPAEANIVYTHAHRTIPSGGHYQLDLNHDGIPDFVLANMFRSLNSSYSGTSSALVYPFNNGPNRVYGRGSLASCLHKGVRVGPGGDFSPFDRMMVQMHWFDGSYSVHGDWANGGKGATERFLGFRFKINGENHYGWARLNVVISDSYPGLAATLTGYAYETVPDKAIIAGETKGSDVITVRPASLGHLAAGAASTRQRHRQPTLQRWPAGGIRTTITELWSLLQLPPFNLGWYPAGLLLL